MEPFEYEGVFWQPDTPQRAIAGRLTFRPPEGLSLDLLGSLDEPNETFSLVKQITPRRIVGVAGKKHVTLDGCQVRNASLDGPGLLRQLFRVSMMLEGAQFTSDDDLSFETVTIGFDQLANWIDRNPFTVAFESDQPNDVTHATKITLTCDIPRDMSEVTDDIEVELTHTWTIGGNRVTEIRSSLQPRLRLKYGKRRQLHEIITDVNGLQDLVSLAIDAVAIPVDVELQRSDLIFTLSSGKQVEVPITARWSSITDDTRDTGSANSTAFFGFDQIEGLKAVARWITISRRYRPVLGLLLTIRYSQRLYEENKFSNVISAAETFHRLRFPNELVPATEYKSQRRKLVRLVRSVIGPRMGNWLNSQLTYSNEPRLRHRLTQLAAHAGDGFAELVGDVDSWARVITWLRNRMTHHDPKQPSKHDLADLGDMTDSLFVLVMLALFRECDLPSEIFGNLTRSPRLAILQGRLTEVIPRLTQEIH